MTPVELVACYPRLYHMAHQGSWPAIMDHGLLSTRALLDQYGVTGLPREKLETVRRPSLEPLTKAGLPGAMLRDQKPMSDGALIKCLQDGLAPKDWYKILNSKSFFWLSAARVRRLLTARAYRDTVQTVLTIDCAGVVAAYGEKILLSPINSGSTIMRPMPRGKNTFVTIDQFPFAERAKSRPLEDNVVELVVDYAVPDIAKYVFAVHDMQGENILAEVWHSPTAGPDDHP